MSDWREDPKEAARILLRKVDNSEVITIAGMDPPDGAFGFHNGRLTCNDSELLRLVAHAVINPEGVPQ